MDPRTKRVKEAAMRFIDGMIRKEELRRVIVSETFGVVGELPTEDVELIGDIELALSEHDMGNISDEELRQELVSAALEFGDFVSCPSCAATYLYIHQRCELCGDINPRLAKSNSQVH